MSKFLNELESNKLLSSFDIPMAKSYLCKTINDAEKYAEEIRFPVVMKILSSDILHKTEANCVFVGVNNKEDVRKTFELIMNNGKSYNPKAVIDGVLIQEMAEKGLEVIIGMKTDAQFGPVIMVGMGGIYVEVFKDISLRLLPIGVNDAYEMIMETKLYEIINGARGTNYDMDELVKVLLRVSNLVKENSSISEIDINPFFLYENGKGGKGVDALIRVD